MDGACHHPFFLELFIFHNRKNGVFFKDEQLEKRGNK